MSKKYWVIDDNKKEYVIHYSIDDANRDARDKILNGALPSDIVICSEAWAKEHMEYVVRTYQGYK